MSICRLILLTTLTTLTTLTMTSGSFVCAAAPALPAPPAPSPTTPPTPTTTQPVPEMPTPLAVGVGIIMITLAGLGAWLAGVFRPGSIHGPERLPPGSAFVPMLLILLIGGGCWMGAQVVFFAVRSLQHARATGGQQMSPQDLAAGDLALIATVPALASMLIVLVGDLMFGLLRPVGLTSSRLPRMLLMGIGGSVIALLLMHGSGYLLAAFYELINYQHPTEHELLGAMKDASPMAKAALVFGACVVAPLFEELLFRGHMQTLLARLFTPSPAVMMRPPAPLAYVPGPFDPRVGDVLPPPPLSPLPYAHLSTMPRPGLPWLAVIITSVVFALVHPLWTAPLIFLLSLCLGYAYERTGSLWVPITMHAVFNTSSTLLFLFLM